MLEAKLALVQVETSFFLLCCLQLPFMPSLVPFSLFYNILLKNQLTPCKISLVPAKNGKVRLLKSCLLFITIIKHSNLFLLDRHQTACARCQLP